MLTQGEDYSHLCVYVLGEPKLYGSFECAIFLKIMNIEIFFLKKIIFGCFKKPEAELEKRRKRKCHSTSISIASHHQSMPTLLSLFSFVRDSNILLS